MRLKEVVELPGSQKDHPDNGKKDGRDHVQQTHSLGRSTTDDYYTSEPHGRHYKIPWRTDGENFL